MARGGQQRIAGEGKRALRLRRRRARRSAVEAAARGREARREATAAPEAAEAGAVEEKAPSDPIGQYVAERGGNRAIRKVLIANNGMAATKAIMSMRHWTYLTCGNSSAIQLVALATPEDLGANADFIRQADDFVEVPGAGSANNYGNVNLIVDLAIRERVDAVWPGWGHASENPNLPEQLERNNITFLGPTSAVMSALGDKIAANILAQTAEVPSIPWSGDGLKADISDGGGVSQSVYDQAMVRTSEEAVSAAERIGYPVMLKASEGGGGKGIRMSHSEDQLKSNFEQVRSEVPGSPMFMMQLCSRARHLEVQIVGDEHGNAVALNGRDCSVQRRFQKIFEEGPPTIAPPHVFKEMESAAQRLTQSIRYRGAGTVEFLYDAESHNFYFLELNPRLQVEHPVTEGLTDVNLPATQLQVAMGIPLTNIPDIRKLYNRDMFGTSAIDFMSEQYREVNRHVTAARITAENPEEGFKPSSGSIQRVMFQSTPRVWGYFSVGANGGIHEYADSQFGHIFASGVNREESRKALVLALQDLNIRGDVRTTTEYLVQLLETQDFRENSVDTNWLDELIKSRSIASDEDPRFIVASAAVWRAYSRVKDQEATFARAWQRGQIGTQGMESLHKFPIEITYEDVKYEFTVFRRAENTLAFAIAGSQFEARVREQSDGTLIATMENSSHRLEGLEEPLGLRLVLDGNTYFLPNQFDPSELRSDVTGKLIRFLQSDGEEVEANKPYAEVEAMKMVMPLQATESGSIFHQKPEGSIIEAGDLLATLTLNDPSKVKRIEPFSGEFAIPDAQAPQELSPWEQYHAALEQVYNLLDGFEVPVEKAAQDLLEAISNPELHDFLQDRDGLWELAMDTYCDIINRFLEVESLFASYAMDTAMADITKANKDSPERVTRIVASHLQLPARKSLILSLLRQAPTLPQRTSGNGPIGWADDHAPTPPEFRRCLERLSEMREAEYGELALHANNILQEKQLPPIEVRLAELRDILEGKQPLREQWGTFDPGDKQALVESPTLAVDLLPSLFTDEEKHVRDAAMEVYVKRVYRAHHVHDTHCQNENGLISVAWSFQFNTPPAESPVRHGMLFLLDTVEDLPLQLSSVLDRFERYLNHPQEKQEPINVLHIALAQQGDRSELSYECSDYLQEHYSRMQRLGVKFVNVIAYQKLELPRYFTFTQAKDYQEDNLYRGERPTIAHLLELARLSNFNLERIPTVNRDLHIYVGTSKGDSGRSQQRHLLLRRISHSRDVDQSGLHRILGKALESLDLAMLDPRANTTTSTRIYVNVLPNIDGSMDYVATRFDSLLSEFISLNVTRLLTLRVDEIELKLQAKTPDGTEEPLRIMASSMTGQWLKIDAYKEYLDPVTGAATSFCMIGGKDADTCFLAPYPVVGNLGRRRAAARRLGTTYIYDFIGLFEKALVTEWMTHADAIGQAPLPDGEEPLANIRGDNALDADGSAGVSSHALKVPKDVFKAHELVMRGSELQFEEKTPGNNEIGMVAWLCEMKTPEYPDGRQIVLIGNDCTFQSGSFGVEEDELYRRVSEFARLRGLPRVYIACNAGARLGLADELKGAFNIAWKDPQNPTAGFEYLYLTDEVMEQMPEGAVESQVVWADGERRHMLTDIIGTTHGIGVENLRGSGMIAGETSKAYEETFTLSYITGRSVGIGAYLCRLGQRNIQMNVGPLILTGHQALNKLLGRQVYTSQDQLGGPQVMMPNGVSHRKVNHDQEGVEEILHWLSYVPKDAFSQASPRQTLDPVDRSVEYVPPSGPYDPRQLISGSYNGNGDWIPGFFDKDSFIESMPEWGRTVVTGRARLGGIPMGVIAVETRTMEARTPADPADAESREAILPQAGGVWFPDSSHKTAQALRDFNRAENLPVMVFANWRGFSGGTRDMYNEVLKFGAQIVDALREYSNPVFIYIPPRGALRGGSWVVLDPTINLEHIEMYADRSARGGILEPPGICEVKYRQNDIIKTMHRTDEQLIELDDDPQANANEISKREEQLYPLYTQIAHEFADLHDRTGRMEAKGVIRSAVEWQFSRKFFFSRLKRRLNEDEIRREWQHADPTLTREGVTEELRRLMIRDCGPSVSFEDDDEVLQWLESNRDNLMQYAERAQRSRQVREAREVLRKLDPAARKEVFREVLLSEEADGGGAAAPENS